jgi:hypothetical protein
MGGTCSTNGGEEKCVWIIGGKTRGKTTRKINNVDGWIILGGILERWDGVMWTGLVWLKTGTGGEIL